MNPSDDELRQFRDLLVSMVTPETASWPSYYANYERANLLESPLENQCAAVAVAVELVFGGEIVYGHVFSKVWKKNCRHYWNRLTPGRKGREVDLSSCQFGGDGLTPLKRGRALSKREQQGEPKGAISDFAIRVQAEWRGVNKIGDTVELVGLPRNIARFNGAVGTVLRRIIEKDGRRFFVIDLEDDIAEWIPERCLKPWSKAS